MFISKTAARLNVYPYSMTVTNDKWGNNRPVVKYETTVGDTHVVKQLVADFALFVRTNRKG